MAVQTEMTFHLVEKADNPAYIVAASVMVKNIIA